MFRSLDHPQGATLFLVKVTSKTFIKLLYIYIYIYIYIKLFYGWTSPLCFQFNSYVRNGRHNKVLIL